MKIAISKRKRELYFSYYNVICIKKLTKLPKKCNIKGFTFEVHESNNVLKKHCL